MGKEKFEKILKLNSLEEAIFDFPVLIQPEDIFKHIKNFISKKGNLLRRDLIGCNYIHLLGDSISFGFDAKPSEKQMSVICRVIELFVKAGIPLDDPNLAGNTPLLSAVNHRNTVMVNALLECGADMNAYNNNKMGIWQILSQPPPFPGEEINNKETEKIILYFIKKNAEKQYGHLKEVAETELARMKLHLEKFIIEKI